MDERPLLGTAPLRLNDLDWGLRAIGRILQRRAAPFTIQFMMDLNTATAAELDAVSELKGHGFEIVRYREERGRFDSLRQLDEVPGLAGKWDGAEGEVEIG